MAVLPIDTFSGQITWVKIVELLFLVSGSVKPSVTLRPTVAVFSTCVLQISSVFAVVWVAVQIAVSPAASTFGAGSGGVSEPESAFGSVTSTDANGMSYLPLLVTTTEYLMTPPGRIWASPVFSTVRSIGQMMLV